ncbi:hypothetical protein [Streptomyces shenzhenensis]|uniref:hypothetical protein n=1 Tax=Streptomyces shenzhenensis TaxID=943815 RepID=UPI0036C3CF4E
MDERMGHEDGSVGARYTTTDSMRQTLMEQLTVVWFESLDARLLLQERAASRQDVDQDHTQLTPRMLLERNQGRSPVRKTGPELVLLCRGGGI